MTSRLPMAAAAVLLVSAAASGNWFSEKVAANVDLKKQIGTGIDAIAAQRIAQIDDLLKARTSDIDALLHANINDVDERLGARIQQVDDLTERRFGNVETLAAKSTATLGSAILRLIGFGCLVIF